MAHWRIFARIHRVTGPWRSTVDVPAFDLPEDLLGIVDRDHAERIARKILGRENVSLIVVRVEN